MGSGDFQIDEEYFIFFLIYLLDLKINLFLGSHFQNYKSIQ